MADLQALDPAGTWAQISSPTVADSLRLARPTTGVPFSVAWWDNDPFLTWFGGSVLLIGLVWPCVIDLLVYGRLVRPRDKRAKLPRRRAEKAATGEALAVAPDAHDEVTDALPAIAPQAPQVRAVQREPLSASPHADDHDKAFPAKADDVYPTEDRTVHPSSDHAGSSGRA